MASSLISSVVLLAVANGARVSRKRTSHSSTRSTRLVESSRLVDSFPSTKFIADVPVLNYHISHWGGANLGELDGEKEQEWVVVMKSGSTDAQMQTLCKMSRNSCNLIGSAEGMPFVEMRGTELDLEAALRSATGTVKYVEPDRQVFMIPEIEADNVEAATWGLERIGAERRSRAGAGASIFVLDTGVRATHREFGSRAAPALDMTSGSPVECQGDAACATDRQGHGTHCAGTAAGQTFGVAPSAKVRAIKVLGDNGGGQWSWSYYALNWLATHKERPAVASMSLGGFGTQQAMRDAVDASVNAGVVVVVAGGNNDMDSCRFSPAFVPSAITVGSVTSVDKRSSFSNYGKCTNIWAPGSDVLSAGHQSDTDSRTLSGTSMACPHVSGAAALLLEADEGMKSPAVLQGLLDNAVLNAILDLKTDDTNALLYVGAGGPPPTPEPAPTPAPDPCPEPSWQVCELCWVENFCYDICRCCRECRNVRS